MRLLILAIAVILVSETLGGIHEKWKHHVNKHNKTFSDKAHELASREKFAKIDKLIELHNKEASEGKKSFFLKHNMFSSDISTDPNRYKGLKQISILKKEYDYGVPQKIYEKSGKPLPESWDWRTNGFNTPVRNQGVCGCCYSFATTASVEAQYAIKKNVQVTLSPQELIDCIKGEFDDAGGCAGTHVPHAFGYIMKHGITEEANFKYTYENTNISTNYCPEKLKSTKRYTISGITHITTGDVEGLRDALVTQGPISIAIDASSDAFDHYSSGIWDGSGIDPKNGTKEQCSIDTDHAVLLVGYGKNSKGDRYWIIKNQWGDDWGEKGYMNLLDNDTDMCGIASYAWFPYL